MPDYFYSCTVCERSCHSTIRADNLGICICGRSVMQRRWSIAVPKPFTPHFNHSVGSYVTSSRDFDDKLKAAGEKAGTTFSRLEPGEMPRPTTDDDIFDTQLRTLHDAGKIVNGHIPIDDAGNYIGG